MIPLMFGPAARRLYGAFHPGDNGRFRGLGVVLCSPFAEEASRTHRFFYVLSERLSRAGVDVLRFDYFGTGDSAGDDGDGELDGWCSDLQAAHQELRQRSSAQQIVWLGARLGGTVAIRCAQRAAPCPQRLLVWDPIVDGVDYLSALRADRVQALETAFSLPDPSWRRRLAEEPTFIDEAVSFAVAPRLREQIQRVSAATLDLPTAIPSRVIADPGNLPVQRWVNAQRARGAPVQPIGLSPTLGWIPDGGQHQAPVPRHALERIMEALDA